MEMDRKVKKKKKNRRNIVSFDEEVVRKDKSRKFLSEVEEIKNNTNDLKVEENSELIDDKLKQGEFLKSLKNGTRKGKKSKETNKLVPEETFQSEEASTKTEHNKKKRKRANESQGDINENKEVSVKGPEVKKEESIRAQKRKKHAKLLEEKKLKSEIASQQNVLNYLSKWKHCREEWKFEKLKQIWLQQNIFNCDKIPSDFWDIVLEYFSTSRGFVRRIILRDALKIIDEEEKQEEENLDENHRMIVQRARDVVQNIQE